MCLWAINGHLWQVTQAVMAQKSHLHFFGSTTKENWSANIWVSSVQQIGSAGFYIFETVVRVKNALKKRNLGLTSALLGAQIQGEMSNIYTSVNVFLSGPSLSPWALCSKTLTLTLTLTRIYQTMWNMRARYGQWANNPRKKNTHKLQCQLSFALLRQKLFWRISHCRKMRRWQVGRRLRMNL